MHAPRHSRGFTLIELMIVIVIIAILAAIAFPSYRDFVRRSARTEAKTGLLQNAQFMERNFTVANRYDQTSGGEDIDASMLPAQQTPSDGDAKYTLSVEFEDGDTGSYLLVATPTGTMEDDVCGELTLDQAGAKGSDDTFENCWGR